jgi:hypothetical protein
MRFQEWSSILATALAILVLVPASAAFVTYQSNVTTARRFLVSQVQTPQYPYTVRPNRPCANKKPA